MHFSPQLQPGEGILFNERVCLTYLQMLWPEGRLWVTDRRLVWAPFEYYMCGMRRAQIDSILTTKLLILTRTVITAKAGHQVVILTAKAQALQHALAYLMAMPES